MESRVYAEAAAGIACRHGALVAFAVVLLLLMPIAYPGGGSAGAQTAANDQTAVGPVTITGCDAKKVTMKIREYEVFRAHNAYRAQKGLPAFCVDADLQAAAQWHSDDMASRNYYDHRSPDGLSTGRRLYESGYACYPMGGENIGVKLPSATAADFTQSWVNSDRHRANIEVADHLRVGIASANDADFGAWYYGHAAYGEYVNYTVSFAGNDCDAPPEDDVTTRPPDDTDPGDGGTDPVPNYSAPSITNLKVSGGRSTRDATPRFSAVARDSQTDLANDNIAIYIDGRSFSNFSYSASADKVSGVSRKLKPGKRHTIRIVANDGEGKSTARSAWFVVR